MCARVRRYVEAQAAWNQFLVGELHRLLAAFDKSGIQVVPLKGAILAHSFYKNLALRPFSDLDLLVRGKDMSRSRELLTSLGYRLTYELPHSSEEKVLRSAVEIAFLHPEWSLPVELHSDIVTVTEYFPSVDLCRLWRRTRLETIAGRKVRTLNDEDLIQILCLHGTRHLWSRLKWVCDLALVLREKPQMDLVNIVGQSRKRGNERTVLLGLIYDLFGCPLPEPVQERIRTSSSVLKLLQKCKERMLLGFNRPGNDQFPIDSFMFYLRANSLMSNRLQMLFFQLRRIATAYTRITERDKRFVRLPASLNVLYFFIRPFRLIIDYVPRVRLRRK